MVARVLQFIAGGDWVRWIAGPIFEKELRVASRRRRHFILRFSYVAILAMFVLMFWASFLLIGRMGRSYRMSQMAEAGIGIVACILWVQFVLMPLVSLVLLSGSIGDEVYRRTLGVLMTTPITSFQIVLGKLASRLLQMVLLLATSLPLLAVVRVFGGVPWDFVVSGLCVTLSATLFAGTLSMWFSISGRRVYVAVIKTVVAMGLLFLLAPLMLAYGHYLVEQAFKHEGPLGGWTPPWDMATWEHLLAGAIFYANPYVVMFSLTTDAVSARGAGGLPFTGMSWPIHCGLFVGLSALLVLLCVWRVRRVGLAEITGDTPQARRRARRAARLGATAEADPGRVRRLFGPPMIWKELQVRMTRSRVRGLIVAAIAFGVLALTYVMTAEILDENAVHAVYVVVFLLLGILITTVVGATGLTSEKEASTWDPLLGTTLSSWEIVLGKGVGAVGRCLPVWLLLAFHLGLFACLGYVHPIVFLHLGLIVAGLVVLLTGTGLFFSACFKHTTSAVAVNLCLVIFVWGLLVTPLSILDMALRSGGPGVTEVYAMGHPIVQAVVVTTAATGTHAQQALSAIRYDWPWHFLRGGGGFEVLATTMIVLVTAAVHMVIGLAFGALATLLVRRR